eukprot:COSAG02_NODE_3005_length_7570_cov_3.554812_4_plen_353_part_00
MWVTIQSRHSCSTAERHAAAQQTIRAATLVLGSFLTSPGSEHAHVTGCEALATLAADGARRVWLRETRIVSGLIDAMARHPSSARVQLASVTALALLAVDHDHREAIVLAGGIGWIATALRAHPADVEVQQFALGALLQVLAEPEQLEGAVSLEAATRAEASLAAFPTHPEIQRLASRLLQRLAATTSISHAVEPESEPAMEYFPISATTAGVGDGTHTPKPQCGEPQPSCSTPGMARAQAFIDSIRDQSSTAVEGEGGPSPEAQHRYEYDRRVRAERCSGKLPACDSLLHRLMGCRYTQIRLHDSSPSHESLASNGKSTLPRSPAQDETTQDDSEIKRVGQDEEEHVQTVE